MQAVRKAFGAAGLIPAAVRAAGNKHELNTKVFDDVRRAVFWGEPEK